MLSYRAGWYRIRIAARRYPAGDFPLVLELLEEYRGMIADLLEDQPYRPCELHDRARKMVAQGEPPAQENRG